MRVSKLNELKDIIESLRLIDMKLAQREKSFLSFVPYDCIIGNGKVIKRDKLLKGGSDGSAAVILPLTKEGNVILAVEPRVFTRRGVGVGLPAGYINEGEISQQAALREMLEELGYASYEEVVDLDGFYQDEGCSSAYNRCFLARDVIRISEPNFDPGEVVKEFECTFDEALELIDLGFIEGCNSIITLERAKKYLRR